ncbi:MAG: dihydroflavonol-4-reductase [Mycobacterium sp.]|nr:dihydroflavonol-4-reductase [Mycobacterium sp.]
MSNDRPAAARNEQRRDFPIIFVTGGNGFIGSVVVRKLLEKGYNVRCLLRANSNIDRIKGLAYQTVIGDVRDTISVDQGVHGCDGVVHLASLSNWNDINSPLMDEVVVNGSRNVLSAAKRAGNSRMVFVSSAAAVNGSTSAVIHDEHSDCTLDLRKYRYCSVKRIVEEACRAAAKDGLPVSIVNPTEVYGPNDTALNTASNLVYFAESSPVLVCKGGTSVVHVDDVAEGIIAAWERGTPGERYILGGDNLSVADLANLTLDILGKKKPVLQIPNKLLQVAGKTAQTLKLPFPISPDVIPYATLFWLMDNQKARTELGIKFRGARETLTPTLAWLSETKQIDR